MKIIKIKSYVFGLLETISNKDFQTLIELFETEPTHGAGVLGGRGKISRATLENDLPVIVKHYKRGGMLRHLVKQMYLKTGKTRCEQEFEMLKKARDIGVSSPRPVAWAYRGRLFYKGWLVIKELENSVSLIDYCLANHNDFDDILLAAVQQVKLLINNKILHVDLHPGNILISNAKVYIIDFDKAEITNMSREKLTGFYIQRWHRAVCKHGLQKRIATFFKENLT